MSDILKSLIAPKTSQDSFHSTRSQPSSPLVEPTTAGPTLPIYDVDTFLNDPNNRSLLSSNTNQNQASSKAKQAAGSNSPPQPIQLGVKTSNHSMALNHLCQARGLVPDFEIDGDQDGYGGALRIGEQTIGSEKNWRSKKEAKEWLAERGVEVVKRIEGKRKVPIGGGGWTSENWIGKLLGM